MTNELR